MPFKVTSNLRVTILKAIAERSGIEPGDEVEFRPAAEVTRFVPPDGRLRQRLSAAERLRLFDEATPRQRRREETMRLPADLATVRDRKCEVLRARSRLSARDDRRPSDG